jgi:hypothetical protein
MTWRSYKSDCGMMSLFSRTNPLLRKLSAGKYLRSKHHPQNYTTYNPVSWENKKAETGMTAWRMS